MVADALIGRDDALARADDLVVGGARLITLTGVAGVGKSRLARALVERARSRGELDVTLLEASELASRDAFFLAAAHALGTDVSDSDREERLARALAANGPLLLVLDGLDALADDIAPTIERWLRDAPELQVLATSRRRLRLRDETLLTVAPLSVPETNDDIAASAAVELWVQITRRVDPSYALGVDAPIVAELVRKLDGLPLAIELAAARGKLMGPREQLARLARRFELLRQSDRAESGLEAALTSSWELLSVEERSALGECSVFRGGFTLPAAESVLTAKGAPRLLEALIDHSWLEVARDALGENRFSLLLSVREFAIAASAASDLDQARRRHAEVFSDRAKSLLFSGPSADFAFAERGNLCAAAECALENGELERATDCLDALELAGVDAPSEIAHRLGERAEATQSASELLSRALRLRAAARARARDFEAARVDFEKAIEAARSTDALAAEGWAALGLALFVERPRGQMESAGALSRRALGCSEDDRGLELQALRAVAENARQRGRAGECLDAIERALTVARARGDRDAEVHHYEQLASHHTQGGDPTLALEYAERALRQAREIGAHYLFARLEGLLGAAELLCEELDDARDHLQSAAGLARRSNDLRTFGIATAYLAWIHFVRGNASRAELMARDAATALQTAGDVRYEAVVRGGLGFFEASADRLDSAEASIAEAERLSSTQGDELLRVAISLCRARLELSLAHRASQSGDTRTSDTWLERVRERLAEAGRPGPGALGSPAERGREVGVLRDWLERAMSSPASNDVAVKRELVVAKNGYWFELDGAPRVDLARRLPMARMLLALTDAHSREPGKEIDAAGMIEHAWPGERMRWDAAQNRLHVTVSRLRNLGLRSALRSTANGYSLDPALRVELVDEVSR